MKRHFLEVKLSALQVFIHQLRHFSLNHWDVEAHDNHSNNRQGQ